MPHELTHASFFSGVGGLDLGLERAGWRTVSFSEVDPYACAVLAQRWPGIPNLGDITDVRDQDTTAGSERERDHRGRNQLPEHMGDTGRRPDWRVADLWSGGFPCQDLSVAGKRRGMGAGTRSGLAYAFLDLVERHRPPAIILENVPGLLSSHRGRDFYALIRRFQELDYVGSSRVLDARYFGVPQRRRRVFIVALDARRGFGAERAAEVLSVGSRCRRHPPTGVEAGPEPAERARAGVDIVGPLDTALGHHGAGWPDQSVAAGHLVAHALRASDGHHGWSSPRGDGGDNLVSPSPDSRGVRAIDELAGWLDDRGGVVNALDTKRGGADDNEAQAGHLIAAFTKSHNVAGPDDPERWTTGREARVGLDSHRYRCCGNGVVSDVAEWIGLRLAEALR